MWFAAAALVYPMEVTETEVRNVANSTSLIHAFQQLRVLQ